MNRNRFASAPALRILLVFGLFWALVLGGAEAVFAWGGGPPDDIDVHCDETNVGDCNDLLEIGIETDVSGVPHLIGFNWGGSGDDIDVFCEELVAGDCDEIAVVKIDIPATGPPALVGFVTH